MCVDAFQEIGEPSTTTNADGLYSFLSLVAGDYEVIEVLHSGWTVSPLHDNRKTVTAIAGELVTAPDFPNFTTLNGSISGAIWDDTHVAVNIDVIASDPRVHIVNHTGINSGIGAGQTATFDIEFIGDGAPHRFDLQFVRSGTNVILGSILVVFGTPNGLVFDANNLATTTLTASDFIFRMKANTGLETANPITWLSAPARTVVNVTPGASA